MNILWLDDMRDPMDYFKPTPARLKSGAFQRNTEFYNNNVFNNGQPNFVWVKTFEEFTNYILKNGLPDMISFDHDLGKGLKKGADCAKWLIQYCKQTGQQMPKCFAHSANPNGRREIGGLLGLDENNNRKNKNIMKINESQLRSIIKEAIHEFYARQSTREDFGELNEHPFVKWIYSLYENNPQIFNSAKDFCFKMEQHETLSGDINIGGVGERDYETSAIYDVARAMQELLDY